MKTLILYHSYSGHTKKIAEELAESEAAGIAEIKSKKRPAKIKAYTAGIISAIRGKAWPIQPFDLDINDYERLILLSPVWAGNPTPPFNALLEQLPSGKVISIKMVSASGESNCKERLEAVIKEKNGTLESFEDIKA